MHGKPAPDFSLSSTGGRTFRSTKERGNKLVLYSSHQGFKAKMKFPFVLLSDEKNMYGRKVRGIGRSAFVIDEKRRAVRAWRGVKVPGHVQEVLNFVKAL